MDRVTDNELERACHIVEILCRSLGRNCQVSFSDTSVEIAPVSWPGESSGPTLYEALKDAQED